MSNFNNTTKALKRWLKEKIRITTATVVVFLISGSIASASNLNPSHGYEHTVEGKGEILIDFNITGHGKTEKGVLNIWEDPKGLAEKNVTVTNKGIITQGGNGEAYAAVNIANAANFINEGQIIINKDGNHIAQGISKTFGGLDQNVTTSSILNNKGIIDIKDASAGTGIIVDGYKKEYLKPGQPIGQDAVEITNEGSINISNLSQFDNYRDQVVYKVNGSFAMGILGKDVKSVTNTGEINLTNATALEVNKVGIKLFDVAGVGMALVNSKDRSGIEANLLNDGTINLKGDHFIGMFSSGDTVGKNTGEIIITGANSIGMYADGGSITNEGAITVDYLDGSSKAMYGINGAKVSNTGSIYLSDIDKDAYSAFDIDRLKKHLKDNIVSKDKTSEVVNTGVVRDKDGHIILSFGSGEFIPGVDVDVDTDGNYIVNDEVLDKTEEENLTADKTVNFSGKDLDVNINASSDFNKEKFLVKVEGDLDVNISGNLIGQDLGVKVDGSNITLDGGKIDVNINNGTAIEANNSTINTEEGSIVGDIVLTNNSTLNMDGSTINNFQGSIIFSDALGKTPSGSVANLGSENVDSYFGGNIDGSGVVNLGGRVEFSSSSKITEAKINIGANSSFILDVAEDKSHALDEDEFNGSLNLGGSETKSEGEAGKLIVKTNNLVVGDSLTIGGIITGGDKENIQASQYIYKLIEEEVSGKDGGTTFTVKGVDASDIGLDEKYSSMFDSLLEGSVNLNSVNEGVAVGELESLFAQTKKSSHGLATSMSRDNIKTWQDLMNDNTKEASIGEISIEGMMIAKTHNTKKSDNTEGQLTGLMAGLTYGLDNSTNVGLAFGAGKSSSEFSSNNKVDGDSFYLGGYVNKNINDINTRLSLGYQLNNLDVKRNISNNYDNLDFKSGVDTEAFNLSLDLDKRLDLGVNTYLRPSFGLNMTYVSQDSSKEENKTMALDVDSHTTKVVEAKLGLDIVREISKSTLVYAGASYSHLMGDTNKSLDARFRGSETGFGLSGVDLGREVIEVSVGGSKTMDMGLEVSAELAYEYGSRRENAKLELGLGYSF